MLIHQRKLFLLLKLTIVSAAVSLLSGCLITSPFWNQEFNNHNQAIPIQAWTTHTGHSLKVECSQAFHGGLYPWGSPSWSYVTTLNAQLPGALDSDGTRAYSVGTNMVLPSNCWRAENTSAGLRYYAAIRVIQVQPKIFSAGTQNVTFKTFDKTGLECLGRENGKDASWYGHAGQGCTKTYSESSTEIPYVIFKAKN